MAVDNVTVVVVEVKSDQRAAPSGTQRQNNGSRAIPLEKNNDGSTSRVGCFA